MKSIDFKISKEEFFKFIDIVEELNKISDTHKIKWDGDNVFIYSLQGDGEGQHQKIDVLKIFILKRDDLFADFAEEKLTWIIIKTKNWLKQVKFLRDDDEDVSMCINIVENKVYSVQLKTSVLQINTIAGDDIIKDVPISFVKEKMNPKYADWTFNASDDLLKRIKKLNKLDTNNEIISLSSSDNEVVVREEALWDLKITPNGAVPSNQWLIRKEHLEKITLDGEGVVFGIFESYIAVKEKNSTMLFTLSLTS